MVYCINCQYFIEGLKQDGASKHETSRFDNCGHSENLKCESYLSPKNITYKNKPWEINKNNNCKWYTNQSIFNKIKRFDPWRCGC